MTTPQGMLEACVELINDWDRHGSIDHSLAFDLHRKLSAIIAALRLSASPAAEPSPRVSVYTRAPHSATEGFYDPREEDDAQLSRSSSTPPAENGGREEKLIRALKGVHNELWVDYCLRMGRTDTDPRPFDAKPCIRIINDALALTPAVAPDGARERVESNLRAIIIRCEEGDKKSDWLPIINNLAKEALSALAHPLEPVTDAGEPSA